MYGIRMQLTGQTIVKYCFNLLVTVLLFLPFAATADKIIACQYTNSTGFIFENNGWRPTRFREGKPFFVKILSSGIVDVASINSIVSGVGSVCQRTWHSISPEEVTCSNNRTFFHFNTLTLEGSLARLNGSVQSDNSRDTVSVSLFTCQGMQ